MTDMKNPHIIIGNEHLGNYLHAILREFQTSHHIYIYYFDNKSSVVGELFQLLQFVGIDEITRRMPPIEIPSKKRPDVMLKRYEIRWDKIAPLKSLKWSP